MDMAPHYSPKNAVAGALSWWRQAGVDCAFGDKATLWLEPLAEPKEAPQNEPSHVVQRSAAPPAAADLPKIGGNRGEWPQDLAAFDAWWLNEPSLDLGSTARRVPPRGLADAELMVLVEHPEAADSRALLSGEQGVFLAAMLRAMGTAPENVRLASVLPSHTPMAEWSRLQAAGLGEVLAHHVKLAAPRRIISFGSNIPPLLGNDPTQSAQTLRTFNQDSVTIPVLAERSLDALMRPKAKAGFWQRWLDWTGV